MECMVGIKNWVTEKTTFLKVLKPIKQIKHAFILLGKSSDEKVFVVQDPSDSGPLLWHNFASFDEGVRLSAFRFVDSDLSISANGSQESAALAPVSAEELIGVTLKLWRLKKLIRIWLVVEVRRLKF